MELKIRAPSFILTTYSSKQLATFPNLSFLYRKTGMTICPKRVLLGIKDTGPGLVNDKEPYKYKLRRKNEPTRGCAKRGGRKRGSGFQGLEPAEWYLPLPSEAAREGRQKILLCILLSLLDRILKLSYCWAYILEHAETVKEQSHLRSQEGQF